MFKSWQGPYKAAILIFTPFLVFAVAFLIWPHLYAGRVLAGFSGAGAGAAAPGQTTFLYDHNGNVTSEVHGEINRVPVPLEKIPEHVQKAFVAVEDERFYRHHGVDPRAIVRAVFSFYTAGRVTEGASTITQQLMKLNFLSPEQTLRRKVKEAALAVEFERRFTKDEILEFYLNRVYFGEGAYGVQSAAKVYFNKDSRELNLAEGALLAGLVQAPSAYDPYINQEGALRRRNVVLEKMVEQGVIGKDTGVKASKEVLNLREGSGPGDTKNHSYFIDRVIDEAVAAVGEEKLFKGGLRIHTTLEPEIQKKAEEIFKRPDLFPDREVEAALVLVENETGAVKALVGGRQYEARRGFNRATQLVRQPGSAFKPVAVYAPAFETGYGPDSAVSDTPFKSGNYEPHNSDRSYYGQINVRTALQWSRNVAAVRLLNQIGIDRGYEMARKLGFELVEEDRCLPLALGGLTRGVSPLQMAGAYAAFANHGIFTKPYTIRYIEDAEGKVIYRHPEGAPVMKASTAETMKDVLRTVVAYGTGHRADIRGVEVAGKTGTTELPDTPVFRGLRGNKDAWFVGFTPRFTAAVWMGYDEKDMDGRHYLTSYGGNQPAEIFRLVMAGVMGVDDRPVPGKTTAPDQELEQEQDDTGRQADDKQVIKEAGGRREQPEERDGGNQGRQDVEKQGGKSGGQNPPGDKPVQEGPGNRPEAEPAGTESREKETTRPVKGEQGGNMNQTDAGR